MKRSFAAALALVLLTAAGCQKTPEDPIVAGKSSDALIEKASAETGGTLAERVNAPERYQSSFSSAGGELTVTVDAAVTVPDADKVPIIRVKPVNITQAQADVLMDKVVQGELYECGIPKTKAEIADEIVAAKQKIAQGPSAEEANMTYSSEDGRITWEEYMDIFVQSLQEQYDAAPETAERKPVTGRLAPDETGGLSVIGENTTPGLGWEFLRVEAAEGEEYLSNACYLRAEEEMELSFYNYNTAEQFSQIIDFAGVDIADIPDVTVTKEEARALCDPVVEALGIPHMTLYAIEKKYGGDRDAPRCCWVLQYTRDLGGVPIAYSGLHVGLSELSLQSEIYFAPWDYERLNFYVNDDGIVGLDWECPYELEETVTEDAALMDFADAMDIFQKMFVVNYDGRTMDVTIDSIRLSYMRVSEQDKNYTGLLVPVWDFYGPEKRLISGDPYTYYDPEISLLTINAIDGSVIDRDLGY